MISTKMTKFKIILFTLACMAVGTALFISADHIDAPKVTDTAQDIADLGAYTAVLEGTTTGFSNLGTDTNIIAGVMEISRSQLATPVRLILR